MTCSLSDKAPCCCDKCVRSWRRLPDTLTATLNIHGDTGGEECSCVDGTTITLTRTDINEVNAICNGMGVDDPIDSTPRWSGSASVCGYVLCLCLRPCQAATIGWECDIEGAESPFSLHVSHPGDCESNLEQSTNECFEEAACEPVVLRFIFGNALLIQWCPNLLTAGVQVTVTA